MQDIYALTHRHFLQQAELFGSSFYVDMPGYSAERLPSKSLQDLHERIKDCQRCRLADSRTNVVFGVGNKKAKLMCIGEAPGFEEDRQGEPFVGAAGQLLTKILAAIGFSREEVYIANIIKCRPPNNRDPEEDEVAECMPFLRQQLEMVRPEITLALGRFAAQNLLGSSEPLSRLRQQNHMVNGKPVVVTYHPAALLRNPQWKRETWEDVKRLRQIYDSLVGDKDT